MRVDTPGPVAALRGATRRLVPQAVRHLRWRGAWLRRTESYRRSPLEASRKLAWWTVAEMLRPEVRFRAGRFAFCSMRGNFSSLVTYVEHSNDPRVYRVLERWLKPGDVVLDVGANVGTYAIPVAHLVGSAGKVVAFEPHPVTFAYLQRNADLNRASNIQVVNKGLSDAPGQASLTFVASNPGESHIGRSPGEGGTTVAVSTIDDEVARLGLASVDFMKIDVEGFELRVLQGACETIERSRGIVVQLEMIEIHAARYGIALAEVADFLLRRGFEPHEATDAGELVRIGRDRLEGEVFWLRPKGDR